MPDRTRTFVAVPVPAKLGEKIVRLQSLLAAEVEGVRWNSPDAFHLTLAFLGDVDNADLHALCRAVAESTRTVGSFTLRIEGLGCFPDGRKPRVLWVGLTGPGLEPLGLLHQAVVRGVRAAGCPPEDDRFHPHITLGRVKHGRGPARDLTPQLRHYQTWSAGGFDVSEVIVFASTLTSDGPVYSPLSTVPLGKE